VIAQLFANARAPWPLRDGAVHVWRFANAQDVGALAGVLSDDERAAAERFVAREHRARYIVQRAAMRCLLARYLGVAPAALRFARGARGKPHVVGAALEFNLSHADDVALLAIARDVALGVDVERYDADLDARALGRVVLAPSERSVRDVAEPRAFLRIWCRKEACLKATGVGLVDDLTAISVVADRVDVSGTIVHVQDLAVDDDHAAALATTAPVDAIAPRALDECALTP